MTAKQYLMQVRGIDRRIEREEEQLERLRARVEAGRMSSITGMPRGGDADWTDTVHALIELEQRHNARIREMCRLKGDAMDLIDRVDDARLRAVLELYFLRGLTWERVAEETHYSRCHVFRLRGQALQSVAALEAGDGGGIESQPLDQD